MLRRLHDRLKFELTGAAMDERLAASLTKETLSGISR
jgi:hypothetical protein